MDTAASLHTNLRVGNFALALVLALLGLGQWMTAAAAPLADYKSRVEQALDGLYQLEEEQGYSNDRDYAALVEQVYTDVRKTLPPDEMVQWEGGGVRVDNSWLIEELENYRRMSPDDARREAALTAIIQRLGAHSDRLSELETAKTLADSSKEEERRRLDGVLRREEFSERPPEQNIFQRMWERIKNWWNNLFPRGGSLQPGETTWLSFIAMIVVFALAVAVVAYVILKLMPYLQRWKSSDGLKLEKRGARIVLGERLDADKSAADLLNEAEELARKGELRAAIRKGYIALLCELGDRKVIALAQHKTNHDYLRAVREKRPLLNEMQKLTNSFENHWYGFTPVTKNDWATFRTGYQQTLKTASLLSDK